MYCKNQCGGRGWHALLSAPPEPCIVRCCHYHAEGECCMEQKNAENLDRRGGEATE